MHCTTSQPISNAHRTRHPWPRTAPPRTATCCVLRVVRPSDQGRSLIPNATLIKCLFLPNLLATAFTDVASAAGVAIRAKAMAWRGATRRRWRSGPLRGELQRAVPQRRRRTYTDVTSAAGVGDSGIAEAWRGATSTAMAISTSTWRTAARPTCCTATTAAVPSPTSAAPPASAIRAAAKAWRGATTMAMAISTSTWRTTVAPTCCTATTATIPSPTSPAPPASAIRAMA